MKAYFIALCVLAISTIFATPVQQEKACLIEDQTAPLFQRYLTKCRKLNMPNQPVYLRNARQEKNPSSNDMTILNLDLPSKMQIIDIAERILYGDADIVHLRNISTNTASHLYELLQQNYTHFIYVPYQENGLFVASKYPLSQAVITQFEQEGVSSKAVLDFVIHETNLCHARVSPNDLSIQVMNSSDSVESTTTPILLVDLPGTLSIVKPKKQQFYPFQLIERVNPLATEMFEVLPVKRGGNDNDNRGGGYGGGRVDIKFGTSGPEWSAAVFGGYEDDQGNYAEVEVRRNENGRISAGAEAGHDNDK